MSNEEHNIKMYCDVGNFDFVVQISKYNLQAFFLSIGYETYNKLSQGMPFAFDYAIFFCNRCFYIPSRTYPGDSLKILLCNLSFFPPTPYLLI